MLATTHSVRNKILGLLGLVLIGVIGWTVDRLNRETWTSRALADVILTLVTVIGWIVDRLPMLGPPSTIARPATTRTRSEKASARNARLADRLC